MWRDFRKAGLNKRKKKGKVLPNGESVSGGVLIYSAFPLTPVSGTLNTEHRTLNIERVSPCTLRLLTPALSSFGEEREEAGAAFLVQGFNARILRGMNSALQQKERAAGAALS
jgi:hypothetical protein